MKSGPPISNPHQSGQNQNQFVADPTIFNPQKSRPNSMMNTMIAMMNNVNKMGQQASVADIPNMVMMVNMMNNLPNMANAKGDNTAFVDMMNALSSSTEIMAKMQGNAKMNKAQKSNVQSPSEMMDPTPSMMEMMINMPAMTNKMTDMSTVRNMRNNIPSMGDSWTPTAANAMLQTEPMSGYWRNPGPSAMNMMDTSRQRRSKSINYLTFVLFNMFVI